MKKQKSLIYQLGIGFILCAFVISNQPSIYATDADQSFAGNKMLIITTSKYAKVLNKYINWKIKRGLDVELDILSAEKGAEAIQQKIQEKSQYK